MSFGLGISFGRLCRRERSLQDVYAEAHRIEGWKRKEDSGCIYEYNPQKRTIFVLFRPMRMIIPTSAD